MRKIVSELLERERKYHLCEKDFNGFQFWQYERFYIDKCLRTSDEPHIDQKRENGWKLLKYYLTKRGRIGKGKQTDICFVSHPRRKLRDGRYECIYTDEIAERFPNAVTLENFYAREHLEPIRSANVVYMDRTIIEAEIYERLMRFLQRKKRQKIAEEICEALRDPLQGILEPEKLKKIARRAAGDYYRYKYSYRKFETVLRRMNPKILVEVVAYGPKCMILNEICKKLGILTIELQHGWIGEEHIAYNYASDGPVRQFPDKIYLFGDYYRTNVRFPISQEQIVSVGFPYYEREQREHAGYRRLDKRYTVLFLSQGMYAQHLSGLAMDLRRCTNENEIRILYKLHPSEYRTWQEIHPMLEESGVEIIGENDMELYDCFATSDAQVGIRSTTIYEGLGFHLRTFIFNRNFQDYLRDLVDLGIAELVTNADEIAAKIQEKIPGSYSVDHFWKENALHNLEQALWGELRCQR